jgi:signal transduction histidine kinase
VPAEGEEGVGTETLSQLLPYIPALLALLAVTWVLLRHPERVGAELLAWGLPLMVLLLWRQYLALRDLRRLSQELETKVVRRTRALEEAQRLALSTERMNTVASLGAGLAHDLNNLIGVTKNYAELAEMGQEEGKPVDPRDLRRIREAATRAGELTTQLMAFGRQQGTPPTTVCLRDHLREKLSLFSMVARPPAQLILEPGEDPLPVLLSASQLDQLIVNLLSNACDAMPKGGRIWVRALREHLEDGRPAARLEVEDQGSGIDPEKLAYIFEPFFTTKEPGRGTGLGLASVRALVEGWEGSLGVESQVGRGTRIWILLPLAEGGHPQD